MKSLVKGGQSVLSASIETRMVLTTRRDRVIRLLLFALRFLKQRVRGRVVETIRALQSLRPVRGSRARKAKLFVSVLPKLQRTVLRLVRSSLLLLPSRQRSASSRHTTVFVIPPRRCRLFLRMS